MNKLTSTIIPGAMLCVMLASSAADSLPFLRLRDDAAIKDGTIQVLFSPRGGITARVVSEIGCANRDICVQAYSFTSRPIADALIEAKRRGVHVEVCADDSNKNPDVSVCDELADVGIEVYLDGQHAISHSKVIVIDAGTVIFGSFNWSRSAEVSNLENCAFVKSSALACDYLHNFVEHRGHCVRIESETQCDRTSGCNARGSIAAVAPAESPHRLAHFNTSRRVKRAPAQDGPVAREF